MKSGMNIGDRVVLTKDAFPDTGDGNKLHLRSGAVGKVIGVLKDTKPPHFLISVRFDLCPAVPEREQPDGGGCALLVGIEALLPGSCLAKAPAASRTGRYGAVPA